MRLNLPILDQLAPCKNILIAGMGGGFDIFCGLPIYFALRERGQRVHLANYSFSAIEGLQAGTSLTDTLVGVDSTIDIVAPYFPELYLAQWFQEQSGEAITIWSFQKTGVQPLLANYRALVAHLDIDAIVLVDGGVDSLMRGDEAEVGTIIEDAISLAAVSALDHVPVRLLACLGLSVETDISYAHLFENIAALSATDAFFGSCALVRAMAEYQAYEQAVLYVHSKPVQDPSVINASVISAVRGEYGDYHLTEKTRASRLWISPLMPIYWFFDLPAVAARSLILDAMLPTHSFAEAMHAFFLQRRGLAVRCRERIPLW